MKKSICLFILFFISVFGLAQEIKLELKEKISREPIVNCHSFIIDPVDNIVVVLPFPILMGFVILICSDH